MKIKIMGAGLTGCSLARMLADAGHDVVMHEQLPVIGGLCRTEVNPDGLLFEPCGARTFHTSISHVWDFVKKFATFNGYIHHKGTIVNGMVLSFPISMHVIEMLPQRRQIEGELAKRPDKPDTTNFETYSVSVFGPTLYRLFIENYTRKMWGIEPRQLAASWAPKRLELREGEGDELFAGQWQGLPVGGYTVFLENMVAGIRSVMSSTDAGAAGFDIVVSSAPIDALLNYRFGKLPYRSLRFDYARDGPWEDERYGTINLPGAETKYIRKANFKILHQQRSEHNYIQYQEPIAYNGTNIPMYPINTPENDVLFDRYLKEVVKSPKLIPTGRLGLYKYLDMDKAVAVSFKLASLIEEYPGLDAKSRHARIAAMLAKF